MHHLMSKTICNAGTPKSGYMRLFTTFLKLTKAYSHFDFSFTNWANPRPTTNNTIILFSKLSFDLSCALIGLLMRIKYPKQCCIVFK